MSTTENTYSDFWPPIIRKFSEEKMDAKYPELKNEHLSLGEMPGGALIESEMMTMMRYTTTAAFFYTPMEWFRSRRRALTPEQKAQIIMAPNFKRNMAFGAAAGAAIGLVKALGQYGFLSEEQVVDKAISLRRDKVQDRWSRTTARMASMSVVPMILYTQGSLPIRVGCGFAIGTVMSIPVSYTELDFAFTYALPG